MKRLAGTVAAVVSASLLLLSCGRNGRVIPDAELSEIIVEMLLSDQWLDQNHSERRTADTTLFYEPVFNRHGYTFKDFDRSISYYIEDGNHFEDILKVSEKMLSREASRLEKLMSKSEKAREFNEAIGGYVRVDFDSLKISLHPAWFRDTLQVVDSTEVVAADTLAVVPIPADTAVFIKRVNWKDVKRRNGIRTDSLPAPRKFIGHKPAPVSRKTVQL